MCCISIPFKSEESLKKINFDLYTDQNCLPVDLAPKSPYCGQPHSQVLSSSLSWSSKEGKKGDPGNEVVLDDEQGMAK